MQSFDRQKISELLLAVGKSYLDEKDYFNAEQIYLLVAELHNSKAFEHLGRLYIWGPNQRIGEGIEMLQRAIFYDPEQVSHYVFLGRAYLDTNQPSEAIDVLSTAVELADQKNDHSLQANTRTLYASALRQLKQYEQALLVISSAISFTVDSEQKGKSYLELGLIFYDQERYEEAISWLRSATEITPGVAATHEWLGLSYLQMGSCTASYQELKTALQLSPGNEWYRENYESFDCNK